MVAGPSQKGISFHFQNSVYVVPYQTTPKLSLQFVPLYRANDDLVFFIKHDKFGMQQAKRLNKESGVVFSEEN